VQLNPARSAGHCLSPAKTDKRVGDFKNIQRDTHTKSDRILFSTLVTVIFPKPEIHPTLLGAIPEEMPLTCWHYQAKDLQPGGL
jgi:hypothetical protein